MAKGKSSSLALSITPEAPLKYDSPHSLFSCILHIYFQILSEFFDQCVFVQMWEDLINKAKNGGLDVIDTYVFWNVHEPSPGNVLCL